MEKDKKILKKETIFTALFVIIAIHPLIELDYLLPDYINIPRLTTILDYLVLPLLVFLLFIFYEKDKKRILILTAYLGVFAIYFGMHCYSAMQVQHNIHLTDNFIFSIKDELLYTIALLLPLIYIFFSKYFNLTEDILKKISITLSTIISWPIFISDIFLFGRSTYQGMTYDNIFSWFTTSFNYTFYHPRRYACKFFFEEGNTIGILLTIVLPLLYYFFFKEKNKKTKIYIGLLIFIQSLSMIILSTRIATYAALLVPIVIFVVYIVLSIINKEKIVKLFLGFIVANALITGLVLPYSPAYQNQLLDAADYGRIFADDNQRESGKELLKDADKLVKWTDEWRYFYTYMFEDYIFLINLTPPVYFTEWYSYKYDPEFWVDVIFDYPLEERVNGRQIETIFTKYKWEELNTAQKLTGFGYSTFMNGGILIERDFVQQYYSYGLIGSVLIFGVWIIYLVYAIVKVLFGLKKGKWSFINVVLLMSICLGFICSVVSGHTFDELTTNMFMALCFSLLIYNIKDKETEII